MKGFPNQVASLPKLAAAAACIAEIIDSGKNAGDDGVLGPALVRAGVAGTGHGSAAKPVEEYINEQLTKPKSQQSFRTTARGIRELFRLMDFIDVSGQTIEMTPLGRRAAAFAGAPLDAEQIEFWREVVRDLTRSDDEGNISHPYQVLLRLVGRKPGISRAKCALALEAIDDTPEELDRIVALADLSEEEIRETIGVSEANWENAAKVLPSFAEQLGDVVRINRTFVLADAPGQAGDVVPPDTDDGSSNEGPRSPGTRIPRSSRKVTGKTIGRAGTAEGSDEVKVPPELDPETAREAIEARADRLRRHNLIVQALAAVLEDAGADLYEDPFDVLAVFAGAGLLIEVKTLDGSEADERERVRDALAQLLYYEGFVTEPVAGATPIRKIACFEGKVSDAHREWLNRHEIAVIWPTEYGFGGDDLACEFFGGIIRKS